MHAALTLLALTVEAICGYPQWLYRAVGHPVSWIGDLLAWCERRWNRGHESFSRRRVAGTIVILGCLAVVAAISVGFVHMAYRLLGAPFAFVVVAIAASALIAQRSLYSHVAAVADALELGDIGNGRIAVSMIVGRDTTVLDEHGVARAAIESLSENFSDGIVAPVFWLVIGGLPGAALYKTVNTADSMIGHKNDRYLAFGWASARLDDLANLPASRLTALLICGAAALDRDADAAGAWRAVWSDAGLHKSPNAGWPEAAMAGALCLRLAGPRVYGGSIVDDHWMGNGRREAGGGDIRRALRLYRKACVLQAALIAVVAAAAFISY